MSQNQTPVVLDRKVYKKKFYYKVKSEKTGEVSWVTEDELKCDSNKLKKFKSRAVPPTDEDEDEWEVEEILDSRIKNGSLEYLLKWRNWDGSPTWEKAESCNCVNLIAAYENPKLKKLWNFQGSNQNLWLSEEELLSYMNNYVKSRNYKKVNILSFLPDFPTDEKPVKLKDGLNIGPLSYEKHWYLIIILVRHICVTKRVLVGDSLNTLVGVKHRMHPVFKRLSKAFPTFQIKPIKMTQMDRSDVCAYYTLAAFERALFLYDETASSIVESIYFDSTRAETIRSRIRPATNGDVSVSLPIPEAFDIGPTCEFCDKLCDSRTMVNKHILRRHIKKD